MLHYKVTICLQFLSFSIGDNHLVSLVTFLALSLQNHLLASKRHFLTCVPPLVGHSAVHIYPILVAILSLVCKHIPILNGDELGRLSPRTNIVCGKLFKFLRSKTNLCKYYLCNKQQWIEVMMPQLEDSSWWQSTLKCTIYPMCVLFECSHLSHLS